MHKAQGVLQGRVRKPSAGPSRTAAAASPKQARPLTDFERRLYQACCCIMPGRVTTYAVLARILGSCPRAVGQGMKRNPYAPTVPCHRVIASDFSLGGYHGGWGTESPEVVRKERMLISEGVEIANHKVDHSAEMSETMLQLMYSRSVSSGQFGNSENFKDAAASFQQSLVPSSDEPSL
mmetsp:Transcript_7887/g.13558  ORF Transcript_7887/g.13558 Transcript_7887/m.13558 type:complete len:179 (+) Transcript_7887:167-703(+)